LEAVAQKRRIAWYRVPVAREDLSRLNRRSNLRGFVQTLGYLGVLGATGTAAFVSAGRLPWPVTVLLVFLHGTCWNFLINGFHELIHDSVFKTRWLNEFFLRIFSFLGWYNHHQFWASHTEHHKYTLHPPDDLEVVLPVKLTVRGYWQSAIINLGGLKWTLKTQLRFARGKLEGPWEHALFDGHPDQARKLFRWSRLLLAGQLAILVVALVMKWWMLPALVTLAPFYGGWLHYLCNNAQHVGMQDNAPDFRLCCRTITLNPFVEFLYWHMNYHTEHHMYAAVPCYNLGKLHRLIEGDLPESPRGLYATWKQIAVILKKQKEDPAYQFAPELSPRRGRVGERV
jgi:fatty acid desaturase